MTQAPQRYNHIGRLKDFCQVGDGAHASIARQEHGVMYLSAKNFKSSGLDLSNVDYISEGDYEKHFGKTKKAVTTPVKGDVLFGIIGSLGIPYTVKDKDRFGLSSSVAILRPSKNLCPDYLYHFMTSSAFQSAVHAIKSGVAQGFLSLEMVKNLPLVTHEIRVQKKIAAILSAYTELIKNNLQRIALLEKMAEEIYREWFARLRFPGYEQARFVKGVPDGWEVKRISEVVDFLSGYSFKSETYTPAGNYGVVTIKNVQDGYFIPECSDFIENVPSNVKKHCYLDCGDILMSLTGNVGRVCHVYGANLLMNQRVAKLVPKLPNASQFIFCTFNNESMIQLIENLSLGSTAQMNLSTILLGKQKVVVPSNVMLKKYEDMTNPMFKEKMSLLQRNILLQKARVRLLPRLISGKLTVENLDIQFPPSMAEDAHA